MVTILDADIGPSRKIKFKEFPFVAVFNNFPLEERIIIGAPTLLDQFWCQIMAPPFFTLPGISARHALCDLHPICSAAFIHKGLE
jgi:hypothetical protein